MSDHDPSGEILTPDILTPDAVEGGDDAEAGADTSGDGPRDDESGDDAPVPAISEPAKVMRIGSMVKQLLDEVHNSELDEASRERLAEIYERSVAELSTALSPDLQTELLGLALPFGEHEVPSEAELRIAKAQLVGWLEGLFHGIQASLMAQQFAAQQQLQQMRQLPPHAADEQGGTRRQPPPQTGTYL